MNSYAGFTFLRNTRVQVPAQLAQDSEWCLEMNILNGIPLFVTDLLQWAVPNIASIVHQDVDISEMLQRGSDEAASEILFCDAPGIRDGYAPAFPYRQHGRFGRLRIEVVDKHPGPFSCKLADQTKTDAAPCA